MQVAGMQEAGMQVAGIYSSSGYASSITSILPGYWCFVKKCYHFIFTVGLAKFPISERREKNQFFVHVLCVWYLAGVCIQQLRYNNSKLLKNDRCGTV